MAYKAFLVLALAFLMSGCDFLRGGCAPDPWDDVFFPSPEPEVVDVDGGTMTVAGMDFDGKFRVWIHMDQPGKIHGLYLGGVTVIDLDGVRRSPDGVVNLTPKPVPIPINIGLGFGFGGERGGDYGEVDGGSHSGVSPNIGVSIPLKLDEEESTVAEVSTLEAWWDISRGSTPVTGWTLEVTYGSGSSQVTTVPLMMFPRADGDTCHALDDFCQNDDPYHTCTDENHDCVDDVDDTADTEDSSSNNDSADTSDGDGSSHDSADSGRTDDADANSHADSGTFREIDFALQPGWTWSPNLPDGLAWLAAAAPRNTGNVIVRNGDSSVGVVLPGDIRQGDQISGTIVPMPLGGNHDGLRLQDPSGHTYPVVPGQTVTFTVDGPVMTWAILGANGRSVASQDVAVPTPSGHANETLGTFVQANCPTVLSGTFDGDASNTSVNIAGYPATVITESPRRVMVVPESLGMTAGAVTVTTTDAGQTLRQDATAANTTLDCPSVQPGQSATADLMITGLDPTMTGFLGVMVTNTTPDMVSLSGGGNRQQIFVDMADVQADGSYHVSVAVNGVGAGAYILTASLTGLLSTAQCPIVNCSPCGNTYFCNDRGKVNCGGARTCSCGGGAGHRANGGPCTFWFCQCPFGRCQC